MDNIIALIPIGTFTIGFILGIWSTRVHTQNTLVVAETKHKEAETKKILTENAREIARVESAEGSGSVKIKTRREQELEDSKESQRVRELLGDLIPPREASE